MSKQINIALVGLGFGSAFVEIHAKHPDVAQLTLVEANPERLAKYENTPGVTRTLATLEEALADPTIDAVHLNSGIPDHARHAIAALEAGKHVACTVPIATSLEDIRAIIAAKRASGRNYMMMETQIYAREFLFACELRDQGTFGRLQMLRGAHYQDMENWPAYWQGLPPMWYSTHAVAPCLAFAKTRAVSVRALGSGTMREELVVRYGNPYRWKPRFSNWNDRSRWRWKSPERCSTARAVTRNPSRFTAKTPRSKSRKSTTKRRSCFV